MANASPGWSLLFPLVVACGAPEAAAPVFPEPHPHLADSVWPVSHGSAWSQGSSPAPGLSEAGAYDVQLAEVGLVSITLAFEPARDDGSQFVWGSTPLEVYRMRVADPPVVTARLPSPGGLADLVSGAYTLVDENGRFHATSGDRIRAFEAEDPAALDGGIVELGAYALDAPAPDESLRGLGMTWDGVLIAVSSAGRVVAVDRDTLTLHSEVRLDGEVSNSLAIDGDGGVYVVTSEAMHRVQWTGERLSVDEADGAWSAAYETGAQEVAGGRLGSGSGSTPSLMTVGEDKLVVITDAQPLMHVVAFWRDAIPEGWSPPEGADRRVAGLAPVTFGVPDAETSRSEQSVLVLGDGAVVVNNDYPEGEGIGPVLQGLAAPGVEKFTWDPKSMALTSSWALPELACPNGIPTASAATGLMYCVGRRGETWTVEAIDWEDGTPRFHVPTGADNRFNSVYAATQIGPDGEIWSGTFGGVVRVRAGAGE